MNRKVLITGGAGYIGSHAQYAFLDQGYDVIIIDNLSTGTKSALSSQSIFYQADIRDKTEISNIFKKHTAEIDAVIHFAGVVRVEESVTDPIKYYENNTLGSLNLLKQIIAHQIPNLIFSSTAAVYGEPDQVPIDEQASLNPTTPYGRSKLMTEYMIKDIAHSHALNYGILRYFNVAGADPQLRTGQSTPSATHLIKVVCETLVGNRPFLEVFGTDYATKDGTCIRDFIHVTDLADAHVKAYEYISHQKKSLVLNCGYNHGYSVKEVAHLAQKVANKKIQIVEKGRREGDCVEVVADNQLMRKILNWSPQYDDLSFILKTAYEWEKGAVKK